MFAAYANIRLLWKVLVAPVILISVLTGVGTFATLMQRNSQIAVEKLMTGPVMQAEVVADFAATALRTQVRLFRLMATAANESNLKKVKSLSTDALAAVSDMMDKYKIIDASHFESTRAIKSRDALKISVEAYQTQARDVVDMAVSDAGSALMLMTRAGRSFADIESAADDLTDASKDYRDQKVGLNNALLERRSSLLLGILAISVISGVLVSVLVGRSITKPIVALVPELKKLANGDFNISFKDLGRKDEIGQISAALDVAIAKVASTIGNIKISATEVSSASAEIATGTTDLSLRTEEQAASLEQTSSSMEQMSVTVEQNAANARQANEFARETNIVAEKGGAVVTEAVAAMAKIEDSSRKMSDIIGVIDEIARQTNLLALNAAVEAARAGDAGRGFAVVALEVRSLAQRSSQAAKDITKLITNSSGQIIEGVRLVNKAGLSLAEVVESIRKVSAVVSNIADASNEQSTGIDEINRALAQMDEVTQKNSALVEENAAAAKVLEDQAKSMDARVSAFRLRDVTIIRDDIIPTFAGLEPLPAGVIVKAKSQPRTNRQFASSGEHARRNCGL